MSLASSILPTTPLLLLLLAMLVHAFNHLLPQSDGSPTVLSSASTSAYIPVIPYDDLTHPQYVQADLNNGSAARRDRRTRVAPYPLSISTSAPSLKSTLSRQNSFQVQQEVPLHSPRPVAYFNPEQVIGGISVNENVQSPLAFTPGAHGTILGSFSAQPESSAIRAAFDELTATQLACMPSSTVSVQDAPSFSSTSSATAYIRQTQSHFPGSSCAQIQMPKVPYVPQVPTSLENSARSFDVSASDHPKGVPHLPDAVPPEASELHFKPSGTLAPPCDTFPTPVELLNELSLRDAEAAQKDHRRVERRKAQQLLEAESLGYMPTDPDTISTHDKKRLYLDCLEQYVVYLHNQLRLAGVEPVPVERVSSGRGLTSRSIRTMIVHLKSTTSKLHVQKRDAEINYSELRAQLGADADSTAPTLAASNVFCTIDRRAAKLAMQQRDLTPTAGPKGKSSSCANQNGDKEAVLSSGTRRHSDPATAAYADPGSMSHVAENGAAARSCPRSAVSSGVH